MTSLLVAYVSENWRRAATADFSGLLKVAAVPHVEVAIAAACVALLALQALVSVQFGLDNLLLLRALNPDQAAIYSVVLRSVQTRTLNPMGWHHYGFLYPSVGVALAWLVQQFGAEVTSVRFLGSLLRLISFASYLGVIWLTMRLGIFLGLRRGLALAAAVVVASVPELYLLAQAIAPDLLQLVLILAAVWIAATRQDQRGVMYSAFVAGLAFGTKFGGVFLLPFIPVPLVLKLRAESLSYREIARAMRLVVLLLVPVFALGWLVFNPYVLMQFGAFSERLAGHCGAVTRGWGKRESLNPLLWLPVLRQQFSAAGAVTLVVGTGLAGYFALHDSPRDGSTRRSSSPQFRALAMILAYVASSLAFLALGVRMRETRYTFFVLPGVVLLATAGIDRACDRLRSRLQPIAALAALVGAATMSFAAMHSGSAASRLDQIALSRAGDFLQRCYGPEVRILYEWYTYVPPTFIRSVAVPYLTAESLTVTKPALIAISRDMTGRWTWKAPGSRFSDHQYVTDRSYGPKAETALALVHSLFDADSPWLVVWERDDEAILQAKSYGPAPDCR